MTDRNQLSDNAWAQIQTLLSTTKGARLLKVPSCRRLVEAVLWILRTGAQWRMLPSRFGAWNSVFKRFSRWCRLGIWNKLHSALSLEADLQHVCPLSVLMPARQERPIARLPRRHWGARAVALAARSMR